MNTETLVGLGLTKPQAKAYICLIKAGSVTPPQLASKIGETRSNTYKILDRLVEIGLAKKSDDHKKLVYRPLNPVVLESQAKKIRDEALLREKQITDSMPALLNYFYTYSEQPGVRFYQGRENIKEVFNDMLRTGQDIYLLRSPGDVEFYDDAFFEGFKKKRARLGIVTHAITPNVTTAIHSPELDATNNFIRTWIPANAYTGRVEWNIYGDKVALISYGQEAIAMIIESPQIADSFRQVFALIQRSTT